MYNSLTTQKNLRVIYFDLLRSLTKSNGADVFRVYDFLLVLNSNN